MASFFSDLWDIITLKAVRARLKMVKNDLDYWRFEHWSKRMEKKPHRMDRYLRLRIPEQAAAEVDEIFNRRAPLDQRIAMNDRNFRKWDFFSACKFLVKCKPLTTVKILHVWTNNKDFNAGPPKGGPPVSVKAGILVNMMLTIPHMAFGLEKDELDELIKVIITLIAQTNKPLFINVIKTATPKGAVKLLESVTDPAALIPTLRFDIEPAYLAYILHELKQNNEDRFNFVFEKFPTEKYKELKGLMADLQKKAGLFEKKKTDKEHKKTVIKRDENVGKLADVLSELFALVGKAEESYPLQKKRHSLEYLREIAHLRPRAKTFGAEKGHRYVNGVLDRAARELRPLEAGAIATYASASGARSCSRPPANPYLDNNLPGVSSGGANSPNRARARRMHVCPVTPRGPTRLRYPV